MTDKIGHYSSAGEPWKDGRQVTSFCPICESSARKLEKAEAKLAIAKSLLEKIEEWRPSSSTYCQGCYSKTETMAGSALAAIEKVGE